MELTLDTGWSAGLLLSLIRISGFVVASPLFPSSIPMVGRIAVVMVLGLFFAEPMANPELGSLIAAGAMNAGVGLALGFLTGLIFYLFAVAGGVLDMTAGLSAAALIDPSMGQQAPIFTRMFNLVGLVLFYVAGGLVLVVRGLGASFSTIALDGSVTAAGGLLDVAVTVSARMLLAGVEVALPAVAALFLVEVVMGMAARFAPQANVFLLGLPLKIFAALLTVGTVVLLFPEAVAGINDVVGDTFVDALIILRGG